MIDRADGVEVVPPSLKAFGSSAPTGTTAAIDAEAARVGVNGLVLKAGASPGGGGILPPSWPSRRPCRVPTTTSTTLNVGSSHAAA